MVIIIIIIIIWPTSGPVSTGMGDRVWVQLQVLDIYLGM